ncbi:MAG TPA: hypothetical protein VMJ72_01220 [Candidatus Paceibacterota bacterium]|nr:hypothetical protein [Candidatus Paceibacterota bacterium]
MDECVVCHGKLEPEMVSLPFTRGTQYGPAPTEKQDGWYCVNCGLRYHHLPSRPPEPKQN